jgi:transcriptional regulator GlxA family with amidase domain
MALFEVGLSLTPRARASKMTSMATHRVALTVFDGVQPLDVAGPHEVFAIATKLAENDGLDFHYEVDVVSIAGGPVRGESGLSFDSQCLTATGTYETVLVAGGSGTHQASQDAGLIEWLRALPPHTRVGSVCTGAFVLAAAGLLDGRTATTHWAYAGRLARRYPNVRIDADPIYICDSGVWTSAGVTSGIDLALAMVERDTTAQLAQHVARWLVMFARRPGGQSQFATPVWTETPERTPIRTAVDAIRREPAADHSLAILAGRSHLSVRHFQRLFVEQTGETPAVFVERIRIDAARQLLETTSSTIAATSTASGFSSTETFRRAFVRRVGVTPDEYRKRFSLTER